MSVCLRFLVQNIKASRSEQRRIPVPGVACLVRIPDICGAQTSSLHGLARDELAPSH